MSKVKIKFWDTKSEGYLSDHEALFLGLCVEQDCFVFNINNDEVESIEPHFYKDGERIA